MRCATATRRVLRPVLISLAALFLVAACQALVQQQAAKEEAEHKTDVALDHIRLMVYTSDLSQPYEKLGELNYIDPLNGETIDTDHINEKLREMAIARWGQQVDAIIHVTTKVGGTDTATIAVSGEAVRIKGNCSGCRHNFSTPAS